MTEAPGGGEVAGRSPVDRGKRGRKRSVASDGRGIPLHPVAAGANRHDAPPLAGLDTRDRLPDRPAVHLDRGDEGRPTRASLDALGFDGAIAGAITRTGVPAPVRAGARAGAWSGRTAG